jgi:hypothetical protein
MDGFDGSALSRALVAAAVVAAAAWPAERAVRLAGDALVRRFEVDRPGNLRARRVPRVVDATGRAMARRALVSAGGGSNVWDLRRGVRERLLAWMARAQQALARLRTDVIGPPDGGPPPKR